MSCGNNNVTDEVSCVVISSIVTGEASWVVVLIMLLMNRVGVNAGIEWELNSIPDSIPGIGLGIGIEKKGIGIELELTKYARNW